MSFLFGHPNQDKQQYDASNKAITQLLSQNADTFNFLKTTATPMITQGAKTLQAPLDYYNKLFSGDRTEASNALGPQLDVMKNNQQTMLQNVNKFAPRGGARTATVASSDTARSAELTKLLQGLKPASADALASLGLNITNLGLGTMGQGSNINATGLSTLLNQANTAKASETAARQGLLNFISGIAGVAGYAYGAGK